MADITKMNEKIAVWEKNLDRLKNGEFGEISDALVTCNTLLNYWRAQADAGYPNASDNVKYYEDLLGRKDITIVVGGSPCTCLSLRKKGRAAMRGKPLDDDCKMAQTTTNEYGPNDDRVFCYGLEDAKSDELLDKCLKCTAHWMNAEPPQEDAE